MHISIIKGGSGRTKMLRKVKNDEPLINDDNEDQSTAV